MTNTDDIVDSNGECAFCGAAVDTLQTVSADPFPKWCEVCRHSLPLHSILDLRATITNREIAQIICAAANVIIKQIGAKGHP